MAVKRDTAEPQRISAMEERGNRRAGERPQIVLCSGRAPRLGQQRTDMVNKRALTSLCGFYNNLYVINTAPCIPPCEHVG